MKKTILFLTLFSFLFRGFSQQRDELSAKDYAHAESFMNYNTGPLVDHASVRPVWISGERFWYRDLNSKGSEFILVDPANGKLTAAFDQEKLATALSSASGKNLDGFHLPFMSFSYSEDGKSIKFMSGGKEWMCNLQTYVCTPTNVESDKGERRNGNMEVLSPDGKRAAYIKDYNLWIRDIANNQRIQLTTDGIKDFGYATDNAGWRHSDAPILRWSPDSRKIATFKQDQRN